MENDPVEFQKTNTEFRAITKLFVVPLNTQRNTTNS